MVTYAVIALAFTVRTRSTAPLIIGVTRSWLNEIALVNRVLRTIVPAVPSLMVIIVVAVADKEISVNTHRFPADGVQRVVSAVDESVKTLLIGTGKIEGIKLMF